MIFTSLPFTTLLNDILHTLFFFNSPQYLLSLPSFSRYLVCRGEFLTLLQVVGSSLQWSYSQINISLYPSFASYSLFSVHDLSCSDSVAVVIRHL